MREDLKNYLGRKVSELPENLRDEVKNQFILLADKIKNADVLTWEEFLDSCSITDGTEDSQFWGNTLEANPQEWVSEKICIVKLNILDFSDVLYETSKEDPSLAVVDWGEPVLIIDADSSSFGDGYIILETKPSSDEWGGEEAELLGNHLLTYKEALKEAEEHAKQNV